MRVLVCDDQAIVRDGLELLLKLESDFEVIGISQDGAEAVEMADKLLPDVVLMDLKMPGMTGVEATRRIVASHPGIKVLILTTFDDDEWVFDAIRAGATGYILKDTPREKVIEAIRGTFTGKSYVDPVVAGKLLQFVSSKQEEPQSLLTEKLTTREVDVLKAISHGLSNTDIAARLHLSEGTVRNHISAIFAKLEITDRTQAAIIAIRHGMDK